MRAVRIVIIMTYFNSNKIRVVFYREENEWSATGENATSRAKCRTPHQNTIKCLSLFCDVAES